MDGLIFILDTLGQELALHRKLLTEKDAQIAELQQMLAAALEQAQRLPQPEA